MTSLLDSALTGKIKEFKKRFINAIESIVSSYDIAGRDEQTYHMLCLGFFIAGTRHGYQIHSNKEAGHGRYDIALYPVLPAVGKRAVILEFKVISSDLRTDDRTVIEARLLNFASTGLNQIENRRYQLDVPICALS